MKENKNLMIILGGVMVAVIFVFGAFVYVSGLRAYARGGIPTQGADNLERSTRNNNDSFKSAGCSI